MEAGTTRWMEERAGTLPLETYHVEVTDIEVLDSNRHKELEDAFREDITAALERRQEGTGQHAALSTVYELLQEGQDDRWSDIADALTEAGLDGYAEQATLVQGRAERPCPSLMRVRFRPEGGSEGERVDDLGEAYVVGQDGIADTAHSTGGGEPIGFLPGQHFGTRMVLDPVEDGKRHSKANAYSIANWASDGDEIELLIKRIPPEVADESSLTPRLFEELEEGDELVVHGPYTDDLMLHTPSERDMVFMATGTGVAPLKSMIDYVFSEGWDVYQGEDRDVWLFLGASWKDDLPYHDTFTALDDAHDHFHYVPTCSREAELTDWDGATEYIQHELLTYIDQDALDPERLGREYRDHLDRDPPYAVEARIDPEEAEFYLCGVTAMVESVRPVFDALDVPEPQRQAEPYG